jgi:hypothetical protein
MPTIWTLGSPAVRTQFSYEGNVEEGVMIHFSGNPRVSADFFKAIIHEFQGRKIPGGFGMTKPTPGGLGEWVSENSANLNVIKLSPRHASFIAAILEHEGLIESSLKGNAVILQF